MRKALIIVAAVLTTLISAGLLLNYLAKKSGLGPIHRYKNIEIPEGLDCSDIHMGSFEVKNLNIERVANKQIETDKNSGEVNEYLIEWKNDCEYLLTPISDTSQTTSVKITSVNAEGYGCYAIPGEDDSQFAVFLFVNRRKR